MRPVIPPPVSGDPPPVSQSDRPSPRDEPDKAVEVIATLQDS